MPARETRAERRNRLRRKVQEQRKNGHVEHPPLEFGDDEITDIIDLTLEEFRDSAESDMDEIRKSLQGCEDHEILDD